jgi:Mechanosensitive ion channel
VTGVDASLDDLSRWARGELLEIVLLVLGAILLTRLAEWVRDRIVANIDAHARDSDELVRSEAAKHRHVMAEVVTWAFLAEVVVTGVLVVQRLGVPLAGLVAPAALLSAALGFGAQRFVQDIGAGFFITSERQYGFGDVVRISVAGVTEPAVGTVEDVTLRVTRIRSAARPEAPHEHASPYVDHRAGRRVPWRVRAVHPGAPGAGPGGPDDSHPGPHAQSGAAGSQRHLLPQAVAQPASEPFAHSVPFAHTVEFRLAVRTGHAQPVTGVRFSQPHAHPQPARNQLGCRLISSTLPP